MKKNSKKIFESNNISKNLKKKKTDNQKLKLKIEKEIKRQDNDKEIKKLKKRKPINFKKINRKNKVKTEVVGTLTKKKRMWWELIICMMVLLALATKIGYIQFVQGEELQTKAYMQQTLDRSINPKRGTIYIMCVKTK